MMHFLLRNWERKLIALFGATLLWLFVDQSIIATKTVHHVPIRVINLPKDYVIDGLLPSGILSKRVTLTLTGSREIIQKLEASDLEIIADAAGRNEEWFLEVTPKNLISLNPSIDLDRHISQISHGEILLKVSKLIHSKIPIKIDPPTGLPPSGYRFLDIIPQTLYHSTTAREREIEQLQKRGVNLTFNLSDISGQDLHRISGSDIPLLEDEIEYLVPERWKKITIGVEKEREEKINDPRIDDLKIIFLREETLEITTPIPLFFFPSGTKELTLLPCAQLKNGEEGEFFLLPPTFIRGVSRLFLQVVQDSLEIVISTKEGDPKEIEWALQVVHPRKVEDRFVELALSIEYQSSSSDDPQKSKRIERLRRRFRDYTFRMHLLDAKGNPLVLKCSGEATGKP